MPDLEVVKKVNQMADSLDAANSQALSAISRLKVIKVNLASLKTLVANDDDFDQAAEDSVQKVIDDLLTEIGTI